MSPSRQAIAGRLWRAYADARTRLTRSGTARSALNSLGNPSRSNQAEWAVESSDRYEDYRRGHDPATDDVTIVCVSKRPHLLSNVVDNVRRQVGVEPKFILVTNNADFDSDALSGLSETLPESVVIDNPGASLGECLNVAMDTSDSRFIAKFDDDDNYGPGYLIDSLRAHSYAGASVVGKHTYYASIEATKQRVLRFPGHEFQYSSTLAGGTLVIDRDRTGDLAFPEISLGEDRAFLAACHRRGLSTFSADRFNFLQSRGSDNTWSIADEAFLQGCQVVDADDPAHAVDR